MLTGARSNSSIHGVYLLESQEKENITMHRIFLDEPTGSILKASQETVELFAMVMNSMKTAGVPGSIHGVWLALLALETGSCDYHL